MGESSDRPGEPPFAESTGPGPGRGGGVERHHLISAIRALPRDDRGGDEALNRLVALTAFAATPFDLAQLEGADRDGLGLGLDDEFFAKVVAIKTSAESIVANAKDISAQVGPPEGSAEFQEQKQVHRWMANIDVMDAALHELMGNEASGEAIDQARAAIEFLSSIPIAQAPVTKRGTKPTEDAARQIVRAAVIHRHRECLTYERSWNRPPEESGGKGKPGGLRPPLPDEEWESCAGRAQHLAIELCRIVGLEVPVATIRHYYLDYMADLKARGAKPSAGDIQLWTP